MLKSLRIISTGVLCCKGGRGKKFTTHHHMGTVLPGFLINKPTKLQESITLLLGILGVPSSDFTPYVGYLVA